MGKYDTQVDLQNIKEMLFFFDVLNHLPTPEKREAAARTGVKIPVILSADDNYSCFVAVTGASILYNTNSFIEFYIISEGISDANKALIVKTFTDITSDFSVEFLECDSTKEFTQIKLPENYHVKLNTCNRLLFPKLAPKVDRAVYLDVDLIVLGDIKQIWDEKLDGHIIGAVPLLMDRLSTVEIMRNKAGIPEDTSYSYFNSGVMLIDYAQWRQKKGSNKQIIADLFNILSTMNADVTPDELILNKFAYLNGGYKVLPHKYNVHPYYSYQYLLNNQKKLSLYEKNTLDEIEACLEKYNYKKEIKLNGDPVVRHFFAHEKPWTNVKQVYFPIPIIKHFENFWFYAKMTPYFDDIKYKFLSWRLPEPEKVYPEEYEKISDYGLLVKDAFNFSKNKIKYWRYKFLSNITFGKKRQKYKNKKKQLKARLQQVKETLKSK